MIVEQYIFEHAKATPDRIAIKSGKDSVSYCVLSHRICAAKIFFESLPCFKKGGVVIMAANKQIEFVYAYFGAHLAGLVVTPLDSETNVSRLTSIVNTVQPIISIGFEKQDLVITNLSYKNFQEISSKREIIQFPHEDSVADILFTTGTTGTPKGVTLTFRNEYAAASQINAYIGNTSQDIEMLALPISHSFGLGRLRCCLMNCQTLILLGSFVNTKRLFRLMSEEKVSGFTMVPSSWKYLQQMTGNQLGEFHAQLKYIEMGSAYLSVDDKLYLSNLLPTTRICMHYGLTEASRSAFMEFHHDKEKLNTVGKAGPNTEIAIFDANGHRLGCNQEGEICIKGDHVTNGYLNFSRDESFFKESFFRTGDYGAIDEDGFLILKARIKELINVGGKKVSPAEVDTFIQTIDGVEDCACVATEDPQGVLGEVVKAFIVKKPNSNLTFEHITSSLTGKLESYKIPIIYEWIDKIPRTQNGKVLRVQLQMKA